MKRVKATIRAGEKERGVVRLRQRDTAIIFTTSDGSKVEVDLLETHNGTLLLRSHNGTVSVRSNDHTVEVKAS